MPSTARGYPYPLGTADAFPPDDFQALAQAVNDDVDTHEDSKTGVHGIPSMASGQGLLWNGSAWVATDLATQSELDAKATDYEYAYSTWKPFATARGAGTSGTNILAPSGSGGAVGTSASVLLFVIPFDPAELTAGSRTNQLRIVTELCPNGVAPGVTFTVALYQPTITKPATGDPYISALGSAVSGSSKTSATMSSISAVTVTSDAFTAPSASYLAIAATASGALAANTQVNMIARLQYRQT